MDNAFVGIVPVPESAVGRGGGRGYHDFYVGYHPDTGEDRFYVGGTGGYYIYDVTNLQDPQLRISLTGVSGVQYGHTFTPSADGRYVIAETEYQYAPLRIFDLQPGARRGGRQHPPTDLGVHGQLEETWCTTTRFAGRTYSSPDTWTACRSSTFRTGRIR